jgi:hypothetical protein
VVGDVVTVADSGHVDVVLSTVVGPSFGVATSVKLLTPEELGDRPYTVLQRQVRGMSCRASQSDPPASEESARANLAYRAGALNAEAVINVTCRRSRAYLNCHGGFFECRGDAIQWPTG